MQKKIKIAFINYSLDVGGIETLILKIGKGLDREIFEPCIFVFEKDGKLKNEYLNSKIGVFEVGKGRGFDWSLPIRLSRILKKHQIDIIHAHNPTSWLYGGVAAKLAGIPLIHTEHTTCDYNNYHVKRWELIEGILSKFTNSITTVSESGKKYMVTRSRINPAKIKVIHNGIRTKDFNIVVDKERVKKDLSLDKFDLVIGNVARFYENKDHRTLINAFKLVKEKFKNSGLILIGEGPLKEEMEDLAKKLNLNDSIRFLGVRRDIPVVLKAMDLFVLSSKREGLPIVLLEAMASGLPVVATDVDGNSEVVIEGEVGFLVPPASPDKLANAVNIILSNPDLANQMKRNAQKRIEEHFNLEKIVKEYEQLYSK